jgi:hypothetical protein
MPEMDEINLMMHPAREKRSSARLEMKRAETNACFGSLIKIWRQPTLAEAIQPLPSARLRLTAVFGMGTGRTTALWPPKNFQKTTWKRTQESSLKTTHRRGKQSPIRELKSLFPCGKKAIKPHDRLVLVR